MDGLFVWAPTPERLADESNDPVDNGRYPLPVNGAVFLRPSEERTSREDVLERLGALEERLVALEDNPPVAGSNTSPWTTETPPFTPDEYLRIGKLVKSVRFQAELEEPDQALLDEETSQLKGLAIRLGHWLQNRLDAGADAFMKTIGKALAVVLIGLYEELVLVCQAVVHWITLLG